MNDFNLGRIYQMALEGLNSNELNTVRNACLAIKCLIDKELGDDYNG